MAYCVYRDANNQWRWRLVAANNRIIANSGVSTYPNNTKAGLPAPPDGLCTI